MMKKKEVYTNITPLPSFIPRQLALDILHSHSEIITLNPLVLDHKPIPAPRDAPAEEFYSTWYEISERIQVVPGTGRLGGSKIHFKGCFHDVPWGVQTHIYAPMGIDLRHNYRVAGSQPGEPPEHRELGVNAPSTGLYLREDIEIRCNFAMVSFVRNQLKAASKVLVDRLIKKAELLDAGVLQAMMDNGKLKTINPADRSNVQQQQQQQQQSNVPTSPTMPMSPLPSPLRYQPVTSRPSTSASSQPEDWHQQQQQQGKFYPNSGLPSPGFPPPASPGKTFANELPGDTNYYQQTLSPNSAYHSPNLRDSMQSTSSHGWSYASSNTTTSRPTSTVSGYAPYVPADNSHGKQQFATELPAMQEIHEDGQQGR
ncbi:hypothetical protein DPV78_008138 [Talaromyces pinophilus]|nr:hypothetical protein DPV78_008138 [Talaromyces pinophilus]